MCMLKNNNTAQAASKEHLAYLQARKRYRFRVTTAQVLLLVTFIALWELAATLRWIDPFIMSQPSRIVRTLSSLYVGGDLLTHVGITLIETVAGFTLGT